MRKAVIRACVPPMALLMSSPATAAEMLTNGSFESPSIGSGEQKRFGEIEGWQFLTSTIGATALVRDGSYKYSVGSYFLEYPSFDGAQHLSVSDFGTQGAPWGIQQMFAVVPASEYVLTFGLGGIVGANLRVEVLDGGMPLLVQDFEHSLGATIVSWSSYSMRFVPTSSETTVRFTVPKRHLATSIDGISVAGLKVNSAVPEPSSWAMMLLGFGFVGGAMRSVKRRQKATVSYA